VDPNPRKNQRQKKKKPMKKEKKEKKSNASTNKSQCLEQRRISYVRKRQISVKDRRKKRNDCGTILCKRQPKKKDKVS